MLLLWWVGAAQGQPAPPSAGNVQTLHPSADAQYGLWTDDAGTAPDGALRGRALLSYTSQPLVWEPFFTGPQAVVDTTWQLDAIASASWGPGRLALDVPILLAGSSDVLVGATAGLGDLALDGKLTVLDPAKAAFGLAVTGRATLPTSTVVLPLGGNGLGWELAAVVDAPLGPGRILVNAGTRGGRPTTLGNLEIGNQLVLRSAGVLPVGERGGTFLELAARIDYTAPFGVGSPVEFAVGGWVWAARQWALRGSLGRGLPSAVGSPGARVLLALAFEPDRKPEVVPVFAKRADTAPEAPQAEEETLAAGVTGTTVQGAGTVPLEVRVQDASGAVVHGAFSWVQCNGTDVRLPALATVDVLPGSCQVAVMAPGWSVHESQIHVPAGESFAHKVVLQPSTPVARLAVDVVDRLARPITDARWLLAEDETELPIEGGRSTVAVRPGTYVLQVRAEGYETAKRTYQVTAGEEQRWRVVLQRERAR
ncbi:MAG: PEGA domain-containing protein [Myxococcales bacterium]|nr:PEGA domain-containing protein [Myxococcales bacterium]